MLKNHFNAYKFTYKMIVKIVETNQKVLSYAMKHIKVK